MSTTFSNPATTASLPAAGSASDVELSIIMPCLNEAETLEKCICAAQEYVDKSGISAEIIVGDNGSTDGSQDIARRCGARVVDVPLRGYGAALYFATRAARGKYIIMADSDFSYDFSGLAPFVEKLRQGYDLVVGNRFAGGIQPGAMPWKNRYIGNPLLSGIGRLFFHCPASDFHCGIRGFSLAAFQKMDLRTTGMEYASEMVIKSTLLRLRIVEVPTTLRPDGRSRAPHLRPWRDGWRHLRFMLLYSPRWLFFYPGLLLMLIGMAAGLWLLPGPRAVRGIVLDVHTLLYAAIAVLIGFNSVTFAFFSKVFAVNEGLLPREKYFDDIFRYVNLETGCVLGILLLLLGLGGSVYAVIDWQRRDFGPVNTGQMLRQIIPAALALVIGSQVILSSLFLSVLGLRVRRLEMP